MVDPNKYTIFISHSSEDEDKALHIYDFLIFIIQKFIQNGPGNNLFTSNTKYEVFFSPISLQNIKSTSKEWNNGLISALEKTDCFISFVTPNTIYSKWANYEYGFISSRKPMPNIILLNNNEKVDLDRAIIGKIQKTHIGRMERTENKEYVLPINDIIDFILEVFKDNRKKGVRKDKLKEELYDWCQKHCIKISDTDDFASSPFHSFVYCFNTRLVYIVGNRPQVSNDESSYQWSSCDISNFVDVITRKITGKHIHVASSPKVMDVGEVVANAAINSEDGYKAYDIIGLYKTEHALPESRGLDDTHKEIWRNVITKHRKEYLKRVDCYIIIGGNANTIDEYNAAIDYPHILIMPLPCFGGTSRRIFNENIESLSKNKFPCCNCKDKYCQKFNGCAKIDAIIAQLDRFFSFKWKKI